MLEKWPKRTIIRPPFEEGGWGLLEASLQQMRKGWLRNAKAAGALQGSHEAGKGMLLFYSAECGLKHIVMANRGYKTTAVVAQEFGHNIRSLVIAAQMSRSELSQSGGGQVAVPAIRRAGSSSEISFCDFHVAMRYAVDLEGDDDKKAVKFLEDLSLAIKKRISV